MQEQELPKKYRDLLDKEALRALTPGQFFHLVDEFGRMAREVSDEYQAALTQRFGARS